jgi:hypothetical protein
MKTLFSSKTLIALAVAVAAAAAIESEANEQPMPPPSADVAPLPEDIAPGTPVAQVVKLVQAGVDAGVIQSYISNCPSAFNLDADKIIALTDAGLPGDLVNAMFAHDKNFLASLPTAATAAPPSPPAAVVTSPPPPAETVTSPPPQEITVNYFYNNLSPYGSWVEIDGYGRCWRPNLVVYDLNWRPYCDRGRWVYTDCGWYWDSDYAWGVTFHYGRWFNSPRHGWCWWPDTVWAPSWVTWRSSSDYCGWAPLPPYTVYQSGIGFCYRGQNVSVSFDFGLSSSYYTFVSYGNFCRPQSRYYCLPPQQVTQIYQQTTVINNFSCHENRLQNNGVSVTVIGESSRHPIKPVPARSLGFSSRHNIGGNRTLSTHRLGADTPENPARLNNSAAGSQFRHGLTGRNDSKPDAGQIKNVERLAFNRPEFNTASPAPNRNIGTVVTGSKPATQPTASIPSARHERQNEQPFSKRSDNLSPRQVEALTPSANNKPASVTTPVRNDNRRNWNGNADNNRPSQAPVHITAPPASIVRAPSAPPARAFNPAQAAPAPVISSDRPSRIESRQNFSQAPVRNLTPAVPAMPSPVQNQPQANNNGSQFGRHQSWLAKDR